MAAGTTTALAEAVARGVDALNGHPDKAKIDALVLLASDAVGDGSEVAAVVAALLGRLGAAPPAGKIAVLYVIDAVIKGAGIDFQRALAPVIVPAVAAVYDVVGASDRPRVARTVQTWADAGLFPGRLPPLFVHFQAGSGSGGDSGVAAPPAAKRPRPADIVYDGGGGAAGGAWAHPAAVPPPHPVLPLAGYPGGIIHGGGGWGAPPPPPLPATTAHYAAAPLGGASLLSKLITSLKPPVAMMPPAPNGAGLPALPPVPPTLPPPLHAPALPPGMGYDPAALAAQDRDSVPLTVLDLSVDTLNHLDRHPVSHMYNWQPARCAACGVRYRWREELAEHAAMHAAEAAAERANRFASQRWYLPLDAWLAAPPPAVVRHRAAAAVASATSADTARRFGPDGSAAAADDDAASTSGSSDGDNEHVVLARVANAVCAICGEPFQRRWDDGREDWVYVGALTLEGGALAHAVCALR